MKKHIRYSSGFKEQALVKVYCRGNGQSIQAVANDLNINLTTLKTWMKKSQQAVNKPPQPKSKRPEDWRLEERLTALHQTYSLISEDLNTWCRERGVFVHQLDQWKTDFCNPVGSEEQREGTRTLRTLTAENQRLERELLRKDKALAEAAALLVLQKKFRALLGGEVE